MIKFVISRKGKSFYDMIDKWDWLVKHFGEPCYNQTTWGREWHDYSGSEDYVNFVFYNEAIATWFKMEFPDVKTPEEFEEMI